MKKVVIIGAGPAGITAGYELVKKSQDYEVIILEESNQVGGIAKTVEHNGNRMDLGGHRFISNSEEVKNWWEEILSKQGQPAYDDRKLKRFVQTSPGGPDPEFEDEVMLVRKRISSIYFNEKFFEYPVKLNSATIKNMGLGQTAKAGFSYLESSIFKKKENNLEGFYVNHYGKQLYQIFFEGYTEKLWGRHPSQISADWGAQRMKGLTVSSILKDTSNRKGKQDTGESYSSTSEDFLYPKLGPGQLWEIAAKRFEEKGGEILFGCKAKGIETANNVIKGVYYIKDGEEKFAEADIIISSMPVKDLIAGMKHVPFNVEDAAKGLPYRDLVVLGILVPSLKIQNTTKIKTLNNLVPECWIYVQDTTVKLGRIQIYNNWSPYMVANPDETAWIGLEYFCNEGDYYWNQSDIQWQTLAVTELVKMGIIEDPPKILDFHKEMVKKAYPAYFDTYSRFDEIRTYLNNYPNLYCIGRNGQHRYNNMDHTMMTAFETVRTILSGKTDKTKVWAVNMASEYNERVIPTVEDEPKKPVIYVEGAADNKPAAANPLGEAVEAAKEEENRKKSFNPMLSIRDRLSRRSIGKPKGGNNPAVNYALLSGDGDDTERGSYRTPAVPVRSNYQDPGIERSGSSAPPVRRKPSGVHNKATMPEDTYVVGSAPVKKENPATSKTVTEQQTVSEPAFTEQKSITAAPVAEQPAVEPIIQAPVTEQPAVEPITQSTADLDSLYSVQESAEAANEFVSETTVTGSGYEEPAPVETVSVQSELTEDSSDVYSVQESAETANEFVSETTVTGSVYEEPAPVETVYEQPEVIEPEYIEPAAVETPEPAEEAAKEEAPTSVVGSAKFKPSSQDEPLASVGGGTVFTPRYFHDEPALEELPETVPAAETAPAAEMDEQPSYTQSVEQGGSSAEPVYTEPAYTEPAYTEPAYTEPAYTEPAYTEAAYTEPAYTEPAYTEPAYTEAAYTEPAYTEPAYTEPAYTEPAYTAPEAAGPYYAEGTGEQQSYAGNTGYGYEEPVYDDSYYSEYASRNEEYDTTYGGEYTEGYGYETSYPEETAAPAGYEESPYPATVEEVPQSNPTVETDGAVQKSNDFGNLFAMPTEDETRGRKAAFDTPYNPVAPTISLVPKKEEKKEFLDQTSPAYTIEKVEKVLKTEISFKPKKGQEEEPEVLVVSVPRPSYHKAKGVFTPKPITEEEKARIEAEEKAKRPIAPSINFKKKEEEPPKEEPKKSQRQRPRKKNFARPTVPITADWETMNAKTLRELPEMEPKKEESPVVKVQKSDLPMYDIYAEMTYDNKGEDTEIVDAAIAASVESATRKEAIVQEQKQAIAAAIAAANAGESISSAVQTSAVPASLASDESAQNAEASSGVPAGMPKVEITKPAAPPKKNIADIEVPKDLFANARVIAVIKNGVKTSTTTDGTQTQTAQPVKKTIQKYTSDFETTTVKSIRKLRAKRQEEAILSITRMLEGTEERKVVSPRPKQSTTTDSKPATEASPVFTQNRIEEPAETKPEAEAPVVKAAEENTATASLVTPEPPVKEEEPVSYVEGISLYSSRKPKNFDIDEFERSIGNDNAQSAEEPSSGEAETRIVPSRPAVSEQANETSAFSLSDFTGSHDTGKTSEDISLSALPAEEVSESIIPAAETTENIISAEEVNAVDSLVTETQENVAPAEEINAFETPKADARENTVAAEEVSAVETPAAETTENIVAAEEVNEVETPAEELSSGEEEENKPTGFAAVTGFTTVTEFKEAPVEDIVVVAPEPPKKRIRKSTKTASEDSAALGSEGTDEPVKKTRRTRSKKNVEAEGQIKIEGIPENSSDVSVAENGMTPDKEVTDEEQPKPKRSYRKRTPKAEGADAAANVPAGEESDSQVNPESSEQTEKSTARKTARKPRAKKTEPAENPEGTAGLTTPSGETGNDTN